MLAGIETLILAFVCWYRVHVGGHWLAITKDWFLGIFACAFILTSAGTSAGLERWIWNVGVYLGQQFNPGKGFLMENFNRAVGQHSETMMLLQNAIPTLPPDARRFRTAHLQVCDGGCKAGATASAVEAARKSLRSNGGRVGRFLALRECQVAVHG